MTSEDMVLECRTCTAFRAHPDKPDVGECRRRAPVPIVMHWPERPEVDEHGRIKGFRMTIWPGVNGDDACMEYTPSHAIMTKLATQKAAAEAMEAGPLN